MNVYSHLTIHDTATALEALPNLAGPLPEPAAMVATGTHGRHIDERFALPLPYPGDGSSREPSDAGEFNETTPGVGGCRNTLEMSELDASRRELSDAGGSAPRRTRTYNPLIKSQLLCQLS
jgi:hypothetical protein